MQMRTGKSCLFTACYSKGVSHHHLHFGRNSKSGKGVGKLYCGKKESFGYVYWIGKLWVG